MTPLRVRPAVRDEIPAALQLLFSAKDDPEEYVQETAAAIANGEVDPAGLVLAELSGNLVGAGLFVPQPGRVAFVWPPGASSHQVRRADIQAALLTEIRGQLESQSISLGQVILDPGEHSARDVLNRHGFPHLTDLHYLLCPSDKAAPFQRPEGWQLETYDASQNADRFAKVLERTYMQTLDCPELDGLRTAEDALDAHRATGEFDPRRWRLLHQNGDDSGLLLVNEHPDRDLLEIVYLGVVPEARGQGLGKSLVEMAVSEARRERRSIVLAVDSRNHIAQRIYREVGFLALAVQSIHLWRASATSLRS